MASISDSSSDSEIFLHAVVAAAGATAERIAGLTALNEHRISQPVNPGPGSLTPDFGDLNEPMSEQVVQEPDNCSCTLTLQTLTDYTQIGSDQVSQPDFVTPYIDNLIDPLFERVVPTHSLCDSSCALTLHTCDYTEIMSGESILELVTPDSTPYIDNQVEPVFEQVVQEHSNCGSGCSMKLRTLNSEEIASDEADYAMPYTDNADEPVFEQVVQEHMNCDSGCSLRLRRLNSDEIESDQNVSRPLTPNFAKLHIEPVVEQFQEHRPRTRSYTDIVGRRAIHTPKPKGVHKTPKSAKAKRTTKTPKTPKTTKNSLKIGHRCGTPKRASPQNVRKKRQLVAMMTRPVMKRRPLYTRKSPRLAAKRKTEDQTNDGASPPKRGRYEQQVDKKKQTDDNVTPGDIQMETPQLVDLAELPAADEICGEKSRKSLTVATAAPVPRPSHTPSQIVTPTPTPASALAAAPSSSHPFAPAAAPSFSHTVTPAAAPSPLPSNTFTPAAAPSPSPLPSHTFTPAAAPSPSHTVTPLTAPAAASSHILSNTPPQTFSNAHTPAPSLRIFNRLSNTLSNKLSNKLSKKLSNTLSNTPLRKNSSTPSHTSTPAPAVHEQNSEAETIAQIKLEAEPAEQCASPIAKPESASSLSDTSRLSMINENDDSDVSTLKPEQALHVDDYELQLDDSSVGGDEDDDNDIDIDIESEGQLSSDIPNLEEELQRRLHQHSDEPRPKESHKSGCTLM